MKAILILLLMLVLTGCGGNAEETKVPTTEPPAAATEPAGSYHPGSTLEMFTEGAVRAYPQQIPDIYGIAAAGSDVLVFSGRETTTVTRLTGENLFRIAERTLDVYLNPWSPSLLITEDRMVYFDTNSRELVWLDESFREFSRLQLPEDLMGTPVITADRLKVWYATAEGVRVMDVESGISRLIKQIAYPVQEIAGLLMNDTVVKLSIPQDENAQPGIMFLDAEIGQLLEKAEGLAAIYSRDDRYQGYRMQDGEVFLIFGKAGEETRELKPAMTEGQTTLLTQSHGAVSYGRMDDRWQLQYYDLTSGRQTAAVFIPETVAPWQYASDDANGRLYFLYYGQAESQILCRWDMNLSQTGDETDYSDAFYTRVAPDTAGLARCAARAAELSGRYGVNIRVYEDALALEDSAYTPELCWQVGKTEAMLDALEEILPKLPENFLTKTMETMGGTLQIHLLAGVQGPEAELGGQFWEGKDAHILLMPGVDLPEAFFHGLFHTMETRLLSKSIALYRWDELNPKGFEYGIEEGGEYLDDDATRAFTDSFAMTASREDQARIFEFACREGNEDFFRSATMQKKLRAVCVGIREAWGLKKAETEFLWEQYLESPLAYTKK